MGKPEVHEEKFFLVSVHHKTNMKWPGIEIEAPRGAAGD